MLEIKALRVEIAGSPILHGVSLRVEAGELVCLLGRNTEAKPGLARRILAEGHTVEADGVGVELPGPFHLCRPGHDDDASPGRAQAAHELRESRPAAVEELHPAIGERADQHEAPELDAMHAQQRLGQLALGIVDLHADVARRPRLDAEEIAGQFPVLLQRVSARSPWVAPVHQPGAALAGVAFGVEAGQPGVQGGREGIGKEQRVRTPVEAPVLGAKAPPEAPQLGHAVDEA